MGQTRAVTISKTKLSRDMLLDLSPLSRLARVHSSRLLCWLAEAPSLICFIQLEANNTPIINWSMRNFCIVSQSPLPICRYRIRQQPDTLVPTYLSRWKIKIFSSMLPFRRCVLLESTYLLDRLLQWLAQSRWIGLVVWASHRITATAPECTTTYHTARLWISSAPPYYLIPSTQQQQQQCSPQHGIMRIRTVTWLRHSTFYPPVIFGVSSSSNSISS